MFFQTETLPFSSLEHARDFKQRELFQSWREGDLPQQIMRHAEDLALLTVDGRTGMPVDLFKGERSLAARVLGNFWQSDLAGSDGCDQIVKAYDVSNFGEATYQYVSHRGTRDQMQFEVGYERLVLPFKIGGGLPQFVTLSTLVSFEIRPIASQNRDSGFGPSHKANSQILLGKDESASSMHLESEWSSAP